MIKYRISLTIPAETLFSLMSRLLPIEDLSVEELVSHEQAQVPPKIPKPEIKRKRGVNLKAGIARIIIEAMSDGKPHKAAEFVPLLKHSKYSGSSVASRLGELQKRNIVRNLGDGTWIVNTTPTAT